MAFTEKISLVVDVVTGQSRSSLSTLSSDLKNADGAFAKMKVGAAGAFDFLKQNAGVAALAAGTAIASFGAKAVGDFQEVALGAGKLRDALGVTAEEASQLQEVAGDLGIGVGAIETAIGRMNKTAGASPDAFDAIGASIARNKDGTMDVVGTFENAAAAIARIPDAGKRAEAAQKIFGRGWQDIAELISTGANGIRDAMGGVEKAKLINDAEIAKAREFRDTLDELKGIGESVSIVVGGELVSALNDLKTIVDQVDGPIKDFSDALDDIPGGDILKSKFTGILVPVTQIPKALDAVATALEGEGIAATLAADATIKIGDAAGLAGEAADEATGPLVRLTDVQGEAADAAKEHADALQDQADKLLAANEAAHEAVDAGFALRDAQREAAEAAQAVDDVMADEDATMQDLAAAMDESSKKAIEVADAQVRVADEAYKAAGATLTATDKVDIHNRSLLEQASTLKGPARQAIVDHIAQLNGIPPEKASEILTLIDQGKVAEAEAVLAQTSRTRGATIEAQALTTQAERDLAILARNRTATVNVRTSSGTGALRGVNVAEAGGTNYGPAGAILVGEEGPEIVQLPQGHRTIPADETARILGASGGGGGTPITVPAGGAAAVNFYVTVHAGMGVNGATVARDFTNALAAAARTEGRDSLRRILGL